MFHCVVSRRTETHREEDDFFIPIENITPTIQQLLPKEGTDAAVLSANQNKVNKAVAQAGMEDVKVVYYASPTSNKNNKDINDKNMENSGSRPATSQELMSLNSSMSSFHTPMGERYGVDKENFAPSPEPDIRTPSGKEDSKTCKKLSYSAADGDVGKTPTTIASESDYMKDAMPLRNSLLSQLDKLTIFSSDEEEYGVELSDVSYESPTKTPCKTDNTLVESILKTPGAVKQPNTKSPAVDTQQKLDFFEGMSLDDSAGSEEHRDPACDESEEIIFSEKNAEAREFFLGKKTAKEEFYKNEFPTFEGPSGDLRKQSILVDPAIGQEVVWNNDDPPNASGVDEAGDRVWPAIISGCSSIHSLVDEVQDRRVVNEVEHYDVEDADDTLTSSFGTYRDYQTMLEEKKENSKETRRASSLSDLTKLQKTQEKNIPVNKPILKNMRTGLTVPHSPEASKR
jgi:hypothetical protein